MKEVKMLYALHNRRLSLRTHPNVTSATEAALNSKSFFLLCLASFSLWLSFYLLTAVLPIYARIGGASKPEIGLIVGILTLASMLIAPVAGSVADRIGRRPIMISGAVIFCLCSAGYAWSASVGILLALRALHGIGVGLYTTANSAAAADLGAPERRAARLSLISANMNLALALGPIAGLALTRQVYFKAPFGISTLLALGALALTVIVGETLKKRSDKKFELRSSISREAAWPATIALCLVATFGSLFAFIPLYAEAEGIGSGLFFAGMAGVIALVRIVAGWLSDLLGRVLMAAVGLVFSVAGLLLLTLIPSTITGLTLAGSIYGIGFGLAHPALMAWSVDNSRPDEQGKALGTYLAAYQLGFALGSMAAGVVIDWAGYRACFAGGAALAFVALVMACGRYRQGLHKLSGD